MYAEFCEQRWEFAEFSWNVPKSPWAVEGAYLN